MNEQLCLPEGVDKATEVAHFEYGYPLVSMVISDRVCRSCGERMYVYTAYNPNGIIIEQEEECECGCPIGMLGIF